MADVITRLKIESGEYDSKIARAVSGLKRMEEECRNVGGTLAKMEKDQLDYVRSLGQMQTVSNSVRGKIGELSQAYVELRAQYNRLTEEEKKSPFGKALSSSLDQLKTRISDSKKELAGIQQELSGSKFGQLGGILDGIGKKMGLNANVTELLTSRTALLSAGIGGSIAILGKATSSWVSYNRELSRQGNITTVTTGLQGGSANAMTDAARAMADTYGVDFRDTINAANTLMTQFGETGEGAMKLIREGMQGMIKGDGPKLLSMIQQYAPSFRDAGISASQLVAIIHNSEGGIFTDQNMNAIVMGIKNIRLMTKSTSEALGKLGIDGQKMSQQLNDGTITIFQALKQVANAVQGIGSSSQAAGEVMQQVFGRQGAMAGTKLGEAIATLNTNLAETKRQTGELGDAYDELYEANVKLNKAIRDCFEYDGWEQMATGIKANLVEALSWVIDKMSVISQGWRGLMNDISGKGNSKGTGGVNFGYNFGSEIAKKIQEGATPAERKKLYDQWQQELRKRLDTVAQDKWYRDSKGNDVNVAPDDKAVNHDNLRYQQAARYLQQNRDTLINGPAPLPPPRTNAPTTGGTRKTTTTKPAKEEKEKELTIQQQIAQLEEEAYKASGERRAEISAQVQMLDEELARQKAIRDELHGIIKETQEVQGVSGFNAHALQTWTGIQQGRLSRADFGSQEYKDISGNLADANTLKTVLEQSAKAGIDAAQFDTAGLWEKILGEENIDDSVWQNIVNVINEKLKKLNLDPIEINFKTGSIDKVTNSVAVLSKNTQTAGSAMNTLGGAISSLEDPSAKVAGLVMQAIGNVALSFSQAMATPKDPWSWIAFAAAGTATMISTIAAIHNATGYANGGIVDGRGGGFVGGTAFSGDNVGNVRLDSGELVLNRSQQYNLSNALRSDGENGGMQLHAVVRGEDIYLSQKNYRNRTGKGEYVRTRR